jgi:hypothetical protein
MSERGACRKNFWISNFPEVIKKIDQSSNFILLDGCQQFSSSDSESELCAACGCHLGFHLAPIEERRKYKADPNLIKKAAIEKSVKSKDSEKQVEQIEEKSDILEEFTVSKTRAFQCPVCLLCCQTKPGIQAHATKHDKNCTFMECVFCLSQFPENGHEKLLEHIRVKHGSEEFKYSCPRCGEKFDSKSNRTRHMNKCRA